MFDKDYWRQFNCRLPCGDYVYLAWVEDNEHAVFQKETKDYKYGTIRVHKDDMSNGNFQYMIENNLSRFDQVIFTASTVKQMCRCCLLSSTLTPASLQAYEHVPGTLAL